MTDDPATFIATAKPGEIADLVAGLDDADLERLIAGTTPTATAEAIIRRLPDFAIDARMLDVTALVRFVVTGGERSAAYDVCFDNGEATVVAMDVLRPRATIELAAIDLARLVTGNASPAIAVLDGRLKVSGDEAFAAELAGFFAVPGTDGPAVDPAAVDAVEVARIVSRAEDGHLRRIMSGGFRGIVLAEVFRRFPDYLDAARAGDLAVSVVWKVTGRPDGEVDRYLVRIAGGACTVSANPGEDAPRDATIAVDGPDFLKLVTGNLNPVLAVLRRKIRITGDLAVAATLNSVMTPPRATR